jgi:hypothetical protein
LACNDDDERAFTLMFGDTWTCCFLLHLFLWDDGCIALLGGSELRRFNNEQDQAGNERGMFD